VPITVGQIKKFKGAGIATMADLAGASGRSVPKLGVASNSHKAVVNLLIACGKAVTDAGGVLEGVKAGGEKEGPLFADNPALCYVESNKEARAAYAKGVVGGTAWLFTLPEWEGALERVTLVPSRP
jgi:hypothetical protein